MVEAININSQDWLINRIKAAIAHLANQYVYQAYRRNVDEDKLIPTELRTELIDIVIRLKKSSMENTDNALYYELGILLQVLRIIVDKYFVL